MARSRPIKVIVAFGEITAEMIAQLPEANRRGLAEVIAEWLADIAREKAEKTAPVEEKIAA